MKHKPPRALFFFCFQLLLPTPSALRLDCTFAPQECPGVKFDLSQLMQLPDVQAPLRRDGNSVEWLRVCQPANEPCETSTVPIDQRAGVQTWSSGAGPTCAASGDLATAKWDLITPGFARTGVKLGFTGGDNGRTSQILFMCNPNFIEGVQASAGEQPPGSMNYVITIETAAACPVGACPGDGWSRGWYIIFFFCLITSIYLICGTYVNYRFREAEGLDIIPQWRYWQQVPGLVKDGCVVSKSKFIGFLRISRAKFREWADSSRELREQGAADGLMPASSS